MARRGRKPNPAAVDLLRGHAGKRKRKPIDTAAPAAGEPASDSLRVASLKVPPPPAHLDALAKAEWRRLAHELTRRGCLRNLDLSVFEGHCANYSRWRAALAAAAAHGLTYERNGVVRMRPEIRIAADCEKRLLAFAGDYGMTPAARARVAHVTGEGKQLPLPGLEPPAPAPAPNPAAPPGPRDLNQVSDDEFRRGPPH